MTWLLNERSHGPVVGLCHSVQGTAEDAKGSWDPSKDDYGNRWGWSGQTALGVLMRETYYRYARVHEASGARRDGASAAEAGGDG